MSEVPPRPLPLSTQSTLSQPPRPQLTPEEYANAVSAIFRLRTGAGQKHKGLAEFLCSAPFTLDVDGSDSGGSQPALPGQQSFLTLYDTALVHRDSYNNQAPPEPQESVDPVNFATLPLPTVEEDRDQLIFLRGYPNPLWLNTLGARHKVDLDFLARHLDFLIPATSEKFPSPALPSSITHMAQLYVTTIGSRDCDRGASKQSDIDAIRLGDKIKMDIYSQELSTGSAFGAGNAIVRYYSTLDESGFAIEQKITINLHNRGQDWTAFIWLDCGNDLYRAVNGPLSDNPDQTQLHPIYSYRHMDGLNPDILTTGEAVDTEPSHRHKVPQTATLLHRRYGHNLLRESMGRGILSTLDDVFASPITPSLNFWTRWRRS